MPFTSGQSGNPKGRPKKDRALTAMLEAAGGRTVERVNPESGDMEKLTLRKAAISGVWQGLTEGQITFLNGSKLPLYSKDYVELVKWLFSHVDGPPKQQVEMSGPGGGPIETRATNDPDEALDHAERAYLAALRDRAARAQSPAVGSAASDDCDTDRGAAAVPPVSVPG